MNGGKKEITWLELLKEKLNMKKAEGKTVSIGDVAGEAKKEWVAIKEGKHPKYSQGKATFSKKRTQKMPHSKKHKNMSHTAAYADTKEYAVMKKLINECPKCSKKYKKIMKTQKNKHRGGASDEEEEDEDENYNTDITMGGGGDSDAVEDDLMKNKEENSKIVGGNTEETTKETTKETSDVTKDAELKDAELKDAEVKEDTSDQKGGKRKTKKRKSKKNSNKRK